MQDINEAAKSEGWVLVTTFENGTTKPLWDIKGLSMSDTAARIHVLTRAKQMSPFHQRAMKEVLMSRAAAASKARKTR